jgi:hypothetical protein
LEQSYLAVDFLVEIEKSTFLVESEKSTFLVEIEKSTVEKNPPWKKIHQIQNPPWKKIHRGKKTTKFKIHRGKKSTVEKNPPIQNPPWKKIHRPRSADSGSTVASDGRTRKCLVTDVSWEEGVTH